MPYIAPEVITEAKRMDLLTYLREYEPGELVKFSSNTYTTRTHDSLKISNGKWMWWSRGIGGKSALDYLIKVRGMDFVQAVQTIMGNGSVSFPTCENIKSYEEQPLLLPEKSPTADVVFDYLFGRGIDYEIINHCLEQELIIESLPYHNAVFIGYDENKEPKYAAYRATNQSRIMGDCTGSKKQYSFRLTAENTGEVHLFECAIDLLSYATLMKLEGKDWRQFIYNAINGKNYLEKMEVETLVDCNIFSGVDELLISWIIGRLENEDIGAKLNGKTIPELCVERRKQHFGKNFRSEYFILQNAFDMIAEGKYQLVSGIKNLVKEYTQSTYKIDRYYRYFYFYFDKLEDTTQFEKIRELVENIYTNEYLNRITVNWNNELADADGETGLTLQRDFFARHINHSKDRVVVIISDAVIRLSTFSIPCEQEKQKQEDLGLHCEVTIDGYTDFIFINRFGQAQHQATLNKAIRRIIRDCNDEQFLHSDEPDVLLPHFSCHSLRHTFTTRMCEAGVNIKVIQDALGHSDISTTLNIYADVTKEMKAAEFKGLDSYFKV